MTERRDCIDEILKALRDRKDRKYVEDNLEDLDSRAQADGSGDTMRDKYFRAAKEMLEEEALKTAVLKRNMRMDALKFRDLRTFVDAAAKSEGGSYALGLEAALVGVNKPLFDPASRMGNQLSVGARSLGAQLDWIGGAVLDMERLGETDPKFAGLDKLFYSRKIEDEIFLEKIELEAKARGRAASPGRTKNEAAIKIAEILQKWDRVKVTALNGEGAWITEHSSFGAPVLHDPDKLRLADTSHSAFGGGLRKGFEQRDREAWAAFTLQRIDAKRMFGTAKDADKKLAEMYGGLVTGDHLELRQATDEPLFGNVARKVSASREFVWKSPEAMLEYMKRYGRFTPTDGWMYSMRDSANKYALMKVFGSKPKETFEELINYAKNRTMGEPERLALNKAAPDGGQGGWLRNRYAVVSGEADRPIANTWSGIVNGWMAVQRMAKLGLTPFAQLTDNMTISRELAYQGLGFFERNSGLFSGYFRGAADSEKREVAELLHTGILGRLRGVTARFDLADAKSGMLTRAENLFFKITGITAMTENKRADAERLMAWHMGRQHGKAFAELGESETRILQAFGIGDKEWTLLHKAEWNEIGGDRYLTPDVAQRISDADMKAYLGDQGTISERAAQAAEAGIGPRNPTPVERARQDLALKLWAYYGERGNYAVLEVGARERAILYQGTQAGSPLNLALRLLLQFKQFPTAMITKVWGREINGGAGGMDRVAGITELMVFGTLYGMLANYLNQYVKGQDPHAQIQNSPGKFLLSGFMRGGAGSIYGDFLMGEFSRHGLTALDNIAGPTFGQTNNLMELYSNLTHMKADKATGSLALRLVRNNTPYANMIYTKAAVDYLFLYRMQEWINPGYLRRYEDAVKRNSGIEFWLKPSQVAR